MGGAGAYHLGHISIHALREEGDMVYLSFYCIICYFYPRPPRGGRLGTAMFPPKLTLFLSTPSARRATEYAGCCYSVAGISIHALREEGDIRLFPGGLRLLISIHALREEGDEKAQD